MEYYPSKKTVRIRMRSTAPRGQQHNVNERNENEREMHHGKMKKQKYEIINIRDKDRVWLGKPRVTAVGHNPPCICKDGRNAHGKHRCQLWYTEHYLEQYFKKQTQVTKIEKGKSDTIS